MATGNRARTAQFPLSATPAGNRALNMTWSPSATPALLRKRAALLGRIRAFFAERGVLEVETPALSTAATSDPAIESVTANVRGHRFWLHTSPEYAMKRLLAAGIGDCYQTCRVFRDGELGRWHQPEFTLLEWYRVGWDETALMDEVEDLIKHAVGESVRLESVDAPQARGGSTSEAGRGNPVGAEPRPGPQARGASTPEAGRGAHVGAAPRPGQQTRVRSIPETGSGERVESEPLPGLRSRDGSSSAGQLRFPSTRRLTYASAFERRLGIDPHGELAGLPGRLANLGIDVPHGLDRDALLDLAFSEAVAARFEPGTLTFIYDYPASQAALAEIKPLMPPVAARFEVFAGAIELANGFRELTDAAEQRARFAHEIETRRARNQPVTPLDEAFLAALEHGLPACAGVAVGVDRLVALAAGLDNIAAAMSFAHR